MFRHLRRILFQDIFSSYYTENVTKHVTAFGEELIALQGLQGTRSGFLAVDYRPDWNSRNIHILPLGHQGMPCLPARQQDF